MTFIATEFHPETLELTGHTETYTAPDYSAALQAVLYTKRLKDGRAFLGPVGCVYASGLGYTVTRDRA